MKEQEFYGQDIDKHMFMYLGEVVSDKQYYSYLKYLEQKDIVDEYYSLLPKYPSKGEMEQSFFVCDMIESYIEHENTIDYKLGQKAKIYQNIYTYETRDYVILVPSSLRELLTESQNQHNCLYRYVLRMAYDNTVILFMRDKKNQSQSLISIEVIDDMIIQALGAYNCRPDEKQRNFLNEYATIKHLTFLSEEIFDWDDEE